MTVSMGNGVDLGNLVTAEVNPVTGGIELIGPEGKPVGRTVRLSNGLPMILPSSGSIGANGALTLTTALVATYPKCFMFFPAGAVFSGSEAGLYFVQMASTTLGVVFADMYVSGKPMAPAVPTPVVSASIGAYTQLTSAVTLLNVTLPGGSLGKNGMLQILKMGVCDSNATVRSIESKLAGNAFSTYSAGGQTTYRTLDTMMNCDSESSQIGNNFGQIGLTTSGVLLRRTVDTTVDQAITMTATLGLATQYMSLEYVIVETVYQQ